MSYSINQNVKMFTTFVNIIYLLFFLRDIHEGYLSLEDADDEQYNLVAKLNNLDKGTRELKKWKRGFFNNLGLLFSAREKLLNNFKSRLFPIKNLDKISTSEPTPELEIEPTKQKESELKFQQEFMNEVIDDEKDINDEIFWNCFKY